MWGFKTGQTSPLRRKFVKRKEEVEKIQLPLSEGETQESSDDPPHCSFGIWISAFPVNISQTGMMPGTTVLYLEGKHLEAH